MNKALLLSDNELIESFQAGNTRAFDTLIDRYQEKIYAAILFMVKDSYLAEDLIQEIFIKIIDNIKQKKYAEEGKFLPWALRISHNYCIDHFRKVKRTPTIKTSDDQDIFEVIKHTDHSADYKMTRSQTHQNIQALVDLLPEEQREIIVLRHYANLSFKEIATMTNCSINTALGRMRYGLINLRKMMNERGLM
ncbi:MAG: sigma-70 family RNA polymerase sigma factor [Chitinophagia bacterium]|jgi:RNA polymerase sigma factor (sigma-70 family)|nr:sigma-70 family RNA polymerase sigma factor [Chitinophagia bacterium]